MSNKNVPKANISEKFWRLAKVAIFTIRRLAD
jgi:hypothetical protein